MATPLPVLYVDDGKAVLRFSEIFGIQEPPRKGEKKERRHSTPRGIYIYLEKACLPESYLQMLESVEIFRGMT
jgi:transcription initiation factor TFIID subunit 1